MNIQTFGRSFLFSCKKHAPEILTGIGIAGVFTSFGMVVYATPKALKKVEEAKTEKEEEYPEEEFTRIDVIKAAWTCYIPAGITCLAAVTCIISASAVNAKRNAALATAYTLSETALKEYQSKVTEKIGEKKEREIRDEIVADKVKKKKPDKTRRIQAGKGNTLCFDMYTGREFYSSMEELKQGEIEANFQLIHENRISLNEYYYAIGLDGVKGGRDVGWEMTSTNQGIEVQYSSVLNSMGEPRLAIDFKIMPKVF